MDSIEREFFAYDKYRGRRILEYIGVRWFKKYYKQEIAEQLSNVNRSSEEQTRVIIKQKIKKLLIDKITTNPYIVTPIPLELADKLVRYTYMSDEQKNDSRWMGELLRRVHGIKGNRKFSADGKGKPNYDQDVGITLSSYEFMQLPERQDAVELITRYAKLFNLFFDGNLICDRCIAEDEEFLARYLYRETRVSNKFRAVTNVDIEDAITESEYQSTPDLKSAIIQTISSPVSIVYGDAGTGKTSNIVITYKLCKKFRIGFRVCAFTGKAIHNVRKRLPDAAPEHFSTIHSLWGYYRNLAKNAKTQQITELDPDDENNPYILVIEEASMAPSWLVCSLLRKIQKVGHHIQLVLTGDKSQLPPIGPGRLFLSVIKSNVFPITELTVNHRTTGESGAVIIPNAQQYKQNNTEYNVTWDDNYFIQNRCGIEPYIDLYIDRAPSGEITNYRYELVAIISPWRGRVEEINKIAQTRLHQNRSTLLEYKFGRMVYKWYINDKVVYTKNKADCEIYNGTEGILANFGKRRYYITFSLKVPGNINTNDILYLKDNDSLFYLPPGCNELVKIHNPGYYEITTLTVKFFIGQNKLIDLPVIYKINEDEDDNNFDLAELLSAQNLELAYCLTTHKAQGSEWHVVIYDCEVGWNNSASFIPGGKANCYTSITRTKTRFFYHGDPTILYDIHQYPLRQTNDRLPKLLVAQQTSDSSSVSGITDRLSSLQLQQPQQNQPLILPTMPVIPTNT